MNKEDQGVEKMSYAEKRVKKQSPEEFKKITGLTPSQWGRYFDQTDDLDRPHYNDFGTELRKVVDEHFTYSTIIKSVVIKTNLGNLTLKREWRKI